MFGDMQRAGNIGLSARRLSDKSHRSPRISLSSALKSPFMSPTYQGNQMSAPDFSRLDAEGVLSNIPLFKRLNADDLHTIASLMERVDYKAGQFVFRQGEAGDAFYIIQTGKCSVLRVDDPVIEVKQSVVVMKSVNFGSNRVPKGSHAIIDKVDMTREYPYTIRVKETGVRGRVAVGEISTQGNPEPYLVATIKAGDFFGEQSLVHGGPRGASVSAEANVTVLRLTRDRFVQNQLASKLTFPRRKGILPVNDDDESFAEYEELPRPSSKDTPVIIRAIRQNDKLNVLEISDAALNTIANGARLQTVKKGQVVIKRGDIEADLFYIVQSGEFTFSSSGAESLNDKLAYLGKAGAGGSFGEVALLHNAPRAATVVCTVAGKLWVISRQQFKAVLKKATTTRIEAYTSLLQNVQLLEGLTQEERSAVAASLVEVHALKGENIVNQGDAGDAFFILIKGTVDVVQDSKVLNTLSADPEENTTHWFGECALLENEPRSASVQVSSDEGHFLALKRIDFERLLGPLEDILREAASNSRSNKLGLVYDESTRMMEVSPSAKKKDPSYALMTLESLDKKAVLGVGGFGAVHLVQHKPTKKVFALKALSKGYVMKMKMQKSVMREKEILGLCDSNFIVKMYRTFKNADTLFFLLEAFLGGELYHLYHRKRWHGSVSKARFYSASVVLAFEFLHSRHVLYRDLKPENLLLDGQGLCKLADMGLAKITSGKTYTTCGTPDYFSPEVIQQSGQTKGVDWWTLGVLIHELLSGHAPFTAESSMATYKKVILGIGKVEMKYASNDPLGASLVVSLLKHNSGDRLPMRPKGLQNLFEHPWYRSLDWVSFRRGQVSPPYVPIVKDTLDSSNFQASKSDAKIKVTYVDPKNGWDDLF